MSTQFIIARRSVRHKLDLKIVIDKRRNGQDPKPESNFGQQTKGIF